MLSDGELLQQYVDRGDDAAFTALVQRHLNVVYRTALRRVGGNAHAADDVTQRVFTALARKASQLKSHATLTGWLYTSTRFAAAELVRGEQRRRKHEQEAQTMNELTSPGMSAEQLEPLLDEIIDRLPDRDREAVLLHFFEQQSFVQIATTLSSTADATRMRVNRALERMRLELGKKGIVSTGAALAAALGSQSAIAGAAPVASAVASNALAQAGAAHLGASVRVAQMLKSSTGIWAAAGLATVAIIGFGVHAIRSTPSMPAPVATISAPPKAIAAPETPLTVSEATEPVASPTPAAIPSNGSVAPRINAVAGSAVEFSSLNAEERNILAFLWQRFDPSNPTRKLVLRIPANAPNYPGVPLLIARKWVKVGPNSALGTIAVMLSAPGVQYCTAHAAEIDAYQPQGNFVLKPLTPAPKNTDDPTTATN